MKIYKYFLPLSLLVFAIPAHATVYTVKPSGGSFTTFSACSGTAVAGDSCVGYAASAGGSQSYAGWTQTHNGTSGNYINFSVNSGDHITLTSGVTINGVSWTTYSGFILTSGFTGNGTTAHNIVISCTGSIGNSLFRINDGLGTGGANNSIVGNTVSASSAGNIVGIYLYGNSNLIDGNTLTGFDGDCMDLGGMNVVVRNNICKNVDGATSGQHIDFVQVIGAGTTPTLSFSLIENNMEQNCTNGGGNCHFLIVRTGSGPIADTVIARYNYAQNLDSQGSVEYGGVGDSAPNGWFYNNTIADTGLYNGNGSGIDWQGTVSGAAGFNNIFYNVQTATSSWSPLYNFSAGGIAENANLAFTTGYSGGWGSPYSTEATYAALHSKDPLFANYPTDDSLSPSSPAIGAGVALTTASGAGSASTSLTMVNAHAFQPGWAGTQADWIRIGSSTVVQISTINYTTNVVTLASPVSWNNGDPIYLYKDSNGNIKLPNASPNVGAYQGGTPPPPPPPPIPNPVVIIGLAPAEVSLQTGASQQFTATVSCASTTQPCSAPETWSVTPTALGAITNAGFFTAGSTAQSGVVSVVATNPSGETPASVSATSSVTVTPPPPPPTKPPTGSISGCTKPSFNSSVACTLKWSAGTYAIASVTASFGNQASFIFAANLSGSSFSIPESAVKGQTITTTLVLTDAQGTKSTILSTHSY